MDERKRAYVITPGDFRATVENAIETLHLAERALYGEAVWADETKPLLNNKNLLSIAYRQARLGLIALLPEISSMECD